MTLTTEVDRYDNPQQLTPEQKYNMSEHQFMKEILVLKNRITRLEDLAIQQQKETEVDNRLELAPTKGPTEPTEEIPTITTPSQEFKRLKRFLLPPPRQDPNKIMMEYNIPESVVNILIPHGQGQRAELHHELLKRHLLPGQHMDSIP